MRVGITIAEPVLKYPVLNPVPMQFFMPLEFQVRVAACPGATVAGLAVKFTVAAPAGSAASTNERKSQGLTAGSP